MKTIIKNLLFIYAFIALSACNGSKSEKLSDIELYPVKAGELYQYVNTKGEIMINPQFSSATLFRDGLAMVGLQDEKGGELYGYIDTKGTYVIPAKYKSATVFNEGLAWVVSENCAPVAINTKGEDVFTLSQAENVTVFREGLAVFYQLNEKGGRAYGCVNKKGEVVINPQFVQLGNFKNGLAPMTDESGKSGYINKKGEIEINPQFDSAGDFDANGLAVVAFGEEKGLIDKKGTYVVNPQFKQMRCDGDLYLINQDKKIGWVDKAGKIVINPQFDGSMGFWEQNMHPVKMADKWGYIDKEGKIVINPQFEEAYPFDNGVAWVQNNKLWGLIDKKGSYVVNPQFEGLAMDVTSNSSGSIFFMSDKVETDFFNMSAITEQVKSMIKDDHVDGNELYVTNIGNLMTKYNLKKSSFKQSQGAHLISSKKVTKDAEIALFVVADPFITTSRWSYRNTLDENCTPGAYTILVFLGGQKMDKQDEVYSEIAKALGLTASDSDNISGTKGNLEIRITKHSQGVLVEVSFISGECL